MGCKFHKSSVNNNSNPKRHSNRRCMVQAAATFFFFLRIEIGEALTTFAEVIGRGKFPLKRVQAESTATVIHRLSFLVYIHGIVV